MVGDGSCCAPLRELRASLWGSQGEVSLSRVGRVQCGPPQNFTAQDLELLREAYSLTNNSLPTLTINPDNEYEASVMPAVRIRKPFAGKPPPNNLPLSSICIRV